jgi:hypothetical protein
MQGRRDFVCVPSGPFFQAGFPDSWLPNHTRLSSRSPGFRLAMSVGDR